jgi:hypothetical protein
LQLEKLASYTTNQKENLDMDLSYGNLSVDSM